MSDRRRLEKILNAPHPDYLEITHVNNINPELGFQAWFRASYVLCCRLQPPCVATYTSPPLGGSGRREIKSGKARNKRNVVLLCNHFPSSSSFSYSIKLELELELIHTQMTQKLMLRAEVGMRVRCANKASAECIVLFNHSFDVLDIENRRQ